MTAHEVLRVLAERVKSGSLPGRRADGLRVALGIEGGGMRGTTSAGMAFALHELGLVPAFDAVYGASAGAINGAWLLSSRPEGLRGWTDPSYAKALIRWPALLRGRPVVDVRTLVEVVYVTTFPMDFGSVLASAVEYHPLATDAASGASTDLRPLIGDAAGLRLALRASASLPFLAGPPVTLHGRRFYDAGVSESIPFRTPLAQGATHILVLRSRLPRPVSGAPVSGAPENGAPVAGAGRDAVRDAGRDAVRLARVPREVRLLNRTMLRKESPELRAAMVTRGARTLADVRRIAELEAAGRALSIRPGPSSPPVSRLTTDGPLLEAAFEAGRSAVHDIFRSSSESGPSLNVRHIRDQLPRQADGHIRRPPLVIEVTCSPVSGTIKGTDEAWRTMTTAFGERTGVSAATGEFDLEDRHALRRVAGLSTELTDVTEVEYRALRLERVVLIGVWSDGTLRAAENSLRELSRLAETAGSVVLDGMIQRRGRVDPATYVGAGKAAELAGIVAATGADTVICDGELSPSQLRRLEGVVKVKVIDRTALILDIFAQHARSREGKSQVELAQLQYMLPRLRGWGESLSRQAGGRVAGGGGIGTRGPGETKIETDRRRIRTRISKLRSEISGFKTGREVQRGQRRRNAVPSVVIAGYTNAGKSSLLNALTGSGVLVEDALFATLDPSVRKAKTPSGRVFTLTDTVGFVRHLPHQLVDAFRSTLEEAGDADLIMHVVDGSDADPQAQMAAVRDVLAEIGAADVPELVVINKVDDADPVELKALQLRERDCVLVSAKTGEGLAELEAAIEAALPDYDRAVRAAVPYDRGDLVAKAHATGEVTRVEHGPEGTLLEARVPAELAAELARFAVVTP